ncbi:MAG: HepT-like ribonuclease domain-containing protein [Methanosarcinales archaeon]|nr:HepT-like ribonuclease domain-containing protein [Methanosarcinales archaeon]
MLSENYEKIYRKAGYILEKLKYLRKNKPDNLKIFIDNETLQMSILYAIHVSIEATVDIAILVGTKTSEMEYIGDYEIFESLLNEGFIQEDTFEKLRRLNGLRNAVVHAYDSLIIEEIYDSYDEIMKDISCVIDDLIESTSN